MLLGSSGINLQWHLHEERIQHCKGPVSAQHAIVFYTDGLLREDAYSLMGKTPTNLYNHTHTHTHTHTYRLEQHQPYTVAASTKQTIKNQYT